MCCIYRAWERALCVGHDNIQLFREPVGQASLFDEYIHVEYEPEIFDIVVRSIQSKIGTEAYRSVYYATLSAEEDALDAAYRFLIAGFKQGKSVMNQLTNPAVMRMMEIRRRVGNEAHYFVEFARFVSLDGELYICHLEPKSDVIWLVAEHFSDRMPSENWMIIDVSRSYAVIHPLDGENYVRRLTKEEMDRLERTEDMKDEYTTLWKTFFDSIAIRQRKNDSCQRNHMPIWMRKHATEFRD